jgi:signal transduction histidine kinase
MHTNIESILSQPIKLILGEKRRDLDDQTFRRLRFLCFAFVVGFGYAGGLFLSDLSLQHKNLYSLALDAWVIVTVIVLSILLRFTNAYKVCFYCSVIVVGIVIPAGYFAPTGSRTIFLAPVVLIVAYFLLGRIGGVLWTFFMFAGHLISYELNQQGIARLSVSIPNLAYSSLALGIVAVLLFIYEGVNMANEHRVAERDRRLREALESINMLNKQLKLEKEGVQHQVEVRTYQLHEEQARLQASIATLELGFLMILNDGTVVTYNPALLRICDFDIVEPIPSLPLIYRKIGPAFDLQTAIVGCLNTGHPFEAKDVNLGDKFIRILGSAIHLQGSAQSLGAVLLFEDMTGPKLLERSENEFVAIASHELRTPLTIIEGNLSLLENLYSDRIVDEKMRHIMTNIRESATHMTLIVNQLITMARLEQKNASFDLKPIDIVQVVNNSLSTLRPLVDEKNLQLKFAMSPRLPKVRADAERLQEVLSNLVGNAIKHTDHGYIEVSAEHVGNNIIIRVTDTGKGISVANQKLLFHKFQQTTDNFYTRENGRSVGLGLYISKLLVEQMGGRIELERSEENKGSTFSITLPVAYVTSELVQTH